MPELPQQRRERFSAEYGLSEKDTEFLVSNPALGDYFEHVASELTSFEKLSHLERPKEEHREKLLKLAANYLMTELSRMAGEEGKQPHDTKITPDMFADFTVRVFHGQVSSSGAQTLLKEMFATGESPDHIIHAKDLEQVSDLDELAQAVANVITSNAKAAEDFKKGKEATLKFLVGMVMKETKGKANPTIAEKLIREQLR